MRNSFKKTTLSLALATGLIGSAAWSTAAQACSTEPYISGVCIMATPNNFGSFGSGTYVQAQGQLLPINQYQALAAIVGTTWGGNMTSTVGVPDLRGRVVVGSGISPLTGTSYAAGKTGGAEKTQITGASVSFALAASNLPAHAHTLNALPTKGVTVTAGIGTLAAATTLTGLTTTTNLAGVTFTSSSSNLTLKAANAAAATTNPTAGSALSTVGFPNAKLYGASAPDTALASTSITGTVSGTLSGNAPGTVSGGTAATSLSGAPSVAVGGATDSTGSTTPMPVTGLVTGTVATLPPYLVMNYYIAVNGIFPVRD